MGPDGAPPNPGKAVASSAPGAGPQDLSGDLERHRAQQDATVTQPPGGYPVTVGGNPDAPADRQTSEQDDTGVATASPGPYSAATQWTGQGGGY